MKRWLLPIMLMSSLTLTSNACAPGEDPMYTENPTPEPSPNPNPDNPDPHSSNNSRSLEVYFGVQM